MEDLSQLLARRRPPEPPEISIIKSYVKQHYNEDVGVTMRERDIVVSVRSSSLAGALRGHAHHIVELIESSLASSQPPTAHHKTPARRLVFRVQSGR